MTARELILYILQNGLENEEVFKDGIFVGFIPEEEAAVIFNVGVASIRAGYMLGLVPGFKIGEKVYVLK